MNGNRLQPWWCDIHSHYQNKAWEIKATSITLRSLGHSKREFFRIFTMHDVWTSILEDTLKPERSRLFLQLLHLLNTQWRAPISLCQPKILWTVNASVICCEVYFWVLHYSRSGMLWSRLSFEVFCLEVCIGICIGIIGIWKA